MTETQRTRSSVFCGHRYRKAPEMIEWLCNVFGFKRHAVYSNPNETIAHAQLTLGGGMIFVASFSDTESQRLLKQPDEIAGAETRHVYLLVPDADEICARARLAGAEIVLEIKNQSYGGRGFTCRDPEGHIWNVGTYDPWEGK
jgi:uncharacterized glyoxalase superfamily protein PhnB